MLYADAFFVFPAASIAATAVSSIRRALDEIVVLARARRKRDGFVLLVLVDVATVRTQVIRELPYGAADAICEATRQDRQSDANQPRQEGEPASDGTSMM